MKKILFIATALTLAACTENQRARQFGGTETINLPSGQQLISATWKGGKDEMPSIWYLTQPMDSSYVPTTKTFQEKSSLGLIEGTVVFIESK